MTPYDLQRRFIRTDSTSECSFWLEGYILFLFYPFCPPHVVLLIGALALEPGDMLRETDSAIPEPGYRPEAWDARRCRGRRSRLAANARRAEAGRVPRRVGALIRREPTRMPRAKLLAMRASTVADDIRRPRPSSAPGRTALQVVERMEADDLDATVSLRTVSGANRVPPGMCLIPEALPVIEIEHIIASGDFTAGQFCWPAEPHCSSPPGLHFPRMPPGMLFPPCRTCVPCVDRMPAVLHFPSCPTCLPRVDRMPAVLHFPPCRTHVFRPFPHVKSCIQPADR